MLHLHTLFNSFVTLLTPLPFPSFAAKGSFLSSFHRIHPLFLSFSSKSFTICFPPGRHQRHPCVALRAAATLLCIVQHTAVRDAALSGLGGGRHGSTLPCFLDFGPNRPICVDIQISECDLKLEFFFVWFFCFFLSTLAQLLTCGASTSTTGGRPTSCSLGARGRGLGAFWDENLRDFFESSNLYRRQSHPSQRPKRSKKK